jgi:HECT-domain (ubiquitin-transferase)
MCVLQAFERGFLMLFAGPAIHLFSATELERLVCGTPLLDFAALQRSARYDGGYHPQHQVTSVLAWARVRSIQRSKAACNQVLRMHHERQSLRGSIRFGGRGGLGKL